LYTNAGLCGYRLVSAGPSVGTSYTGGIGGTNLGNDCPTSSPTETTSARSPTSSPTSNKPCCDELRENPIFCCLEARKPAFALSVCQECGK